MRIGMYDQPVDFYVNLEPVQDSFGDPTLNSDVPPRQPRQLYTRAWCLVESLEGKEFEAVMQRWPMAKYRITTGRQTKIRLSPLMTAIWDGRELDILDIQDVPGRHRIQPQVVLIARDLTG